MGRGNDAIPTWSGFNYQGKMMLLYVLELINQIAKDKNKDIDAYSVELEKTEDFFVLFAIQNINHFIRLRHICLKINGIVIVKRWTNC